MKLSLSKKTAILIVTVGVLLGLASAVVCGINIRNMVSERYEERATGVANSTAAIIDVEALEKHLKNVKEIYESIPGDKRIESDEWGSPEFDEYVGNYDHRMLRRNMDSKKDDSKSDQ